ncbi:MAG: biotin/lipoyl-containing protein [Clostridiales bacterium]|nr:biotin/lipoyl-containing protein [Clostridiales bacterium]
MKEVVMPKLGITMKEGVILRWLVNEGDRVKKGMPLLEVESDKAVIEIEALESGVLAGILKKDGETVPVAETIAVIDENYEEV